MLEFPGTNRTAKPKNLLDTVPKSIPRFASFYVYLLLTTSVVKIIKVSVTSMGDPFCRIYYKSKYDKQKCSFYMQKSDENCKSQTCFVKNFR